MLWERPFQLVSALASTDNSNIWGRVCSRRVSDRDEIEIPNPKGIGTSLSETQQKEAEEDSGRAWRKMC